MVEGEHDFGTVFGQNQRLDAEKAYADRLVYRVCGWLYAFASSDDDRYVLLICNGIGIWGNNQPVGWAFPIINFVWWIGIGHAGTLISAILLLLNQKWRTSINRFAEAMTLFAVACAGMYPLLHTGRPWLAYWMFPYSEYDGNVAKISKPFDVGRFCGFDVCDGFGFVLVYRLDSGYCDAPRPCKK